ncbi:MAG: FadR/GntR family transcriptional regulator [Synergistaceae bacterium]|nr:FadR/GntR family transcriptional regulator [Synergistaceae bacterium]
MLRPVMRKTLSQTILCEIITAIKNGLWQPGERMPSEKELANSFSVSRNSVREAIKTLNNMNILESRPGQGTFLSKDAIRYILSSELIEDGYRDASLFEITEIRALLEAQSAYWAADRATDEELEELKQILLLGQKSKNGTIQEQDRVHYLFHDTIVKLANNSFVVRLLSSIQAEIAAQRSKFDDMSPIDVSELIQDQEEIINFILQRKPEKAREAMNKHLNKGLLLIASNVSGISSRVEKNKL